MAVETPKPLFDTVLLVREEKKLQSGLVLPEGSTQYWPVVAAAGPECKYVKLGDRVMLNCDPAKIGHFDWDKRYAAVKETDIGTILPGDPPNPDVIVEPTSKEKLAILQ